MTGTWLTIEPERREVLIDGMPARLGVRAFDVLVALAQQHGQLVPKSALLDLAWPGLVVEENNLEVQVSMLRRLIGRDAILTVAGRGYSLALSPAPAAPGEPADPWRFQMLPAAPPPHNLPQALTSFIGREADIAQLLELARKTRLITLTGSGGCGKTRLSIELAHALLPRFANGAWLVELAASMDPALVPQTVAKTLGLRESPGKSFPQLLAEYLGARRVLLVLDNAEHLLDACAHMVETVLSLCPGVTILVSSRALLGLIGELTYRVPSLTIPDPRLASTPARLEQCDAVRLFVERVQLHRPNFALDDSNAAHVAAICNRLDGIPLAIELAAARLRSLSLDDVADRLDDRFELLVGGSRTALPRHQTLRALIDWSHDLLDGPERRVFERISVFSQGFSLEAAEAVCIGDGIETRNVLPLLTALADKSLLSPEDAAAVSRFRVLETISQYAHERLQEAGGLGDWRGRHLAYFVAWVERAETGLKGAYQGAWLKRLEADHNNLRAALQESLSSADRVESGLRLAAVLWRFWSNRGHAHEGLSWIGRLLKARPDGVPAAVTAKALHGAGVMAHIQCDYATAGEFHLDALAIRRTLTDDEGVADSLHCLSASTMMLGQYEQAEALAAECLAMRRRSGNPRSVAGSLNNVASLAAVRGDLLTAAPLYEEAVRLHRAAGNDHGIALGLVNLGVIAASLGDFALAAQRHEEALGIHRALDDGRAIAMDLVHLGQVALERGNLPDARAHYRECLSSVREQGDALCAVELLQGMARLALATGSGQAAARLYGAAHRQREEIGAPIEPVDRQIHETRIASVRQALTEPNAFDLAWRQGQSMSMDEALREAVLLCAAGSLG